jgi:hypothetical protein
MISKITGGATKKIFEATALLKHKVSFYECVQTGFVQTEEPYWLEEAYSSAITKLDIGLIYRNLQISDKFSRVIPLHFNAKKKFLDFAGGYGMFTRLMRDKGFDFYHSDIYCENIFAKNFDASSLAADTRFELLTAMEVFEHLVNPVNEIAPLFNHSDNILFTTELIPASFKNNIKEWWYCSFETGQHVSLYTEESLRFLAKKFGYNFYTDGHMLHLFSKKSFSKNPFHVLRDSFIWRKLKKIMRSNEQKRFNFPPSLLQADWKNIKDGLNNTGNT